MDFKFVHAADLHLDSPLTGLDPPAAMERLVREATFAAFKRVVDLCLRERVLFLAIAGDLFDQKDRSVKARLFLREQLQRLDAAGIRTFIVHGNHDPLSGDSGALRLPPSVTVFGPGWSEVPVEQGGRVVCRVQGISYPEREVTEDLSRHFKRLGPEPTVGVLHANVGGNDGHANYSPCSAADLAERGLDYWALGHVHTRESFELAGGGVAAYPGNPQGRHPNETGARGCLLVEVEDRRAKTRFVPVDVIRWHRLEVEIGDGGTLDGLLDRIEAAIDALPEAEVEAHALRLSLVGRGSLHRELAGDGLTELTAHLRERIVESGRRVLVESVRAATRPAVDFDALQALGGLPAAVWGARSDPEALAAALALEELKAIEGRLKRCGMRPLREEAKALQATAATRAVELLAEEEVAG